VTKLSVVINTLNEEADLASAIKSVKKLADEIVVVDMESTDGTAKLAKSLGAKVFSHKKLTYVEPARNFGVNKATCDWILILDVDEEIPVSLAKRIKEIVKSSDSDYFRIPRKNIIFGSWMEHTRWWPDYNIRLFKKGFVVWSEEIHKVPVTKGRGADLPDTEEFAIIHNNYKTIDDYLSKMIRYTQVQSADLIRKGYKFEYTDIVKKPLSEFLSRYFAGQGYKDGLHGLILSGLQAFSELVLYVRVWGIGGYKEKDINKKEIATLFNKGANESKWWIRKEFSSGLTLWLKNLQSH
jgi:(heptosyl)LPS beta-1,4-glucosyltransferase